MKTRGYILLLGFVACMLVVPGQSVRADDPSNDEITDAWLDTYEYIVYEPLQGLDWVCYTNRLSGFTCPDRLMPGYSKQYCPCPGGTQGGPYEWSLFKRVHPVEDEFFHDQMNYKDTNGDWVFSNYLIHTEWVVKCYDEFDVVQHTCFYNQPDLFKKFSCQNCP